MWNIYLECFAATSTNKQQTKNREKKKPLEKTTSVEKTEKPKHRIDWNDFSKNFQKEKEKKKQPVTARPDIDLGFLSAKFV